MDPILVIVTAIALTLAAVMGALLARTIREERRRSDARVQLLEQLAAKRAPHAGVVAPALDVEFRQPQEVAGVHELFREEQESSPWPRRFAVIGGMTAALAIVIFGVTRVSAPGSAAPESAVQAPATAAPLELLSLRHANDGGILTVTGLVQNPRSGAPLARVHATLSVFGPGGTLVASGRAPLDFTTLTPGDESPFVIRVPVSGSVERYRVGFRGPDDRVLAHVDRRTADAIAQRQP